MARIEFPIITADPATADTVAYNTACELFGCNVQPEDNRVRADPSHVSVVEIGTGERVNAIVTCDGTVVKPGDWKFDVVAEYGPPF